MIEGMGYTEDGKVWMAFGIMVNNQKGRATMILTPEEAEIAAKNLNEAADKARNYLPIDIEAEPCQKQLTH